MQGFVANLIIIYYIPVLYRPMEVSNSGPNTSPSDLASLFECPVCFEYVLPPILQCQSGHLVCSNCRPKLSCCPTCRGTLGNIRNLGMEKVSYVYMSHSCVKTF